jgi:DNA polymerase-3 subunit epsilon
MALALSAGVHLGVAVPFGGSPVLLEELHHARLAALCQTDLWDVPYSVVDIETTGSIAGRDGITEVGLVRVDAGRVTRTFSTFINPVQPIPPFISNLTGITDAMVAGAPRIGDMLPAIVDFVGDSVVVGHNVRFDLHFIDTELRRHGRRPLSNVRLDTLALARRTIAEVPNYKLGTLTRELGIDVERHHRALADATATAQLLVHCIRKLEDRAVFTLGTLLEHLQVRPMPRRRPATRRIADAAQLPVWTSVLRTELAAVPSKPGVYTLRDASDRIIYVGKSKNLRQRLRAYATGGTPAGGKIQALRAATASFNYTVTGCELEALLVEAELVRAHDPPFNDRLRNFRQFGFIKVETGERGRLLTTTRLHEDGARYFGPYRSTDAARAAVAALQDALGLDCGEGEPALPPAHREALLADAVAFIEGSADDVLLAVARRRDEAAARGKEELVEREEVRLDRLRRLRVRHGALEAATRLHAVVMAPSPDPAQETTFVFCGGRLVGQRGLPRRLPQRGEAVEALGALIDECFHPAHASRCFVKQHEIDQLHIFASWYDARKEGLYYTELPDRRPEAPEARVWAATILDGQRVT